MAHRECCLSICRKNEETNAKILERNDVPGCVLENNKPIKIPPYFSPHLALFPSPSISCQNSRHTGLSPALRLALPFPRSGLSQILHPIYNTLLPLLNFQLKHLSFPTSSAPDCLTVSLLSTLYLSFIKLIILQLNN